MAAVDSFQLLYRELSRSCSSYLETLALIGALYAASRAVLLLRDCCMLIRVHFIPRIIQTKNLRHRFGDWALVHGGSEPVALTYAEELARQGISIIFITKDQTSVRDTAVSLSQTYGVETMVVLADLSLNQAASKPVREALQGKDIGFLVTCLEQDLWTPHSLVDTPEQKLLDSLNRNVAAATLMTQLVLPGMLERGRGAVVNILSGYGCRPLCGRVMHAASTGFMDHLSRALQLEYGRRGIFIQSLTPLRIASYGQEPSPSSSSLSSAASRRSAGSWFVPKPSVFARHAVSTLGVSHKTTGYWPHTLQLGILRRVPDWIWDLGFRLNISLS